jgi:hypothetical protein
MVPQGSHGITVINKIPHQDISTGNLIYYSYFQGNLGEPYLLHISLLGAFFLVTNSQKNIVHLGFPGKNR